MFNKNLKVVVLLLILFAFSTPSFANPLDRESYGNASLLSEIFIKRHSGKNFELLPVTEDHIQALIQSARWAPSSYNDQPWNFVFCDRFKTPEAYLKAVDSIYGQDWVDNVSLLVIVVVRSNFLYNDKFNEWAQYDTGSAALSMSLQAADMGLMAHQIGGFDKESIQESLHIPEGYTPMAIIAIGYENGSPENDARIRRPVEENFFMGEWGSAVEQDS